jgi:glycosyltransferase involved in cell wall biosynthesis
VEGLLAEFDPNAVADAIWELYRNDDRRSRLSAAAAEKIHKFDRKSVHDRMEEIYGSIR